MTPICIGKGGWALDAVRIGLYIGLLVHWSPAFVWFEENFGAGAWRLFAGNMTIYAGFPRLPSWLVAGGAIVFVGAMVSGLLGWLPRVSATLCLVGAYFFHKANALNTLTLALQVSFGILLVLAVTGAGSCRWRVGPRVLLAARPSRYENAATIAIVFYLASGIFYAGIEKCLSGWLTTNRLYAFLSSPEGVYVRDWVLSAAWLRRPETAWWLGWATVVIEIGAPLALVWRPLRRWAAATIVMMLVGFVAVLQLPLLFPAVYLPMFFAFWAGGANGSPNGKNPDA